MTDLTPVQQLQAARDVLVKLRDESFAGEWKAFHSGVANGDHSYVIVDDEAILSISANDGIDEEFRRPTADLIVTLHATTPALIAWLDDQLARMKADIGTGSREVHYRDVLALARSILGAVQA
jgi:hypothetical protein